MSALPNFDASYRRLREKLVLSTSRGPLLEFVLDDDDRICALGYHTAKLRFVLDVGKAFLHVSGPSTWRHGPDDMVAYRCTGVIPMPYPTAMAKISERVEAYVSRAILKESRAAADRDAAQKFLGWLATNPQLEVGNGPSDAEWQVREERVGPSRQRGARLFHQPTQRVFELIPRDQGRWCIDIEVHLSEENVKDVLTLLRGFVTLPGQK